MGAGISGLTVAHALHRRHEVTVYEAAGYPGGHTNTVRVEAGDGTYDVDTGFIVFNDRNYPNFERLLRGLGVAWQPSVMSFSVSAESEDFEFAGTPRGLFAQRRHLVQPRFMRMISDYRRFNREAGRLLTGEGEGPSLGDFLERHRFSRLFIDRLIVPQASAVWSADPSQMWSFPARFLAQFFAHHGMLSVRGRPAWRTVVGGSHAYVRALTAPFRPRIRLSTPVTAIRRDEDGVEVAARGHEPERFDQVVVAAHSDQALRLLEEPSDREREILGAIPYQVNEAVLHTDRRLLPRRRAAWSSWNFHLLDEPIGRTTVTYHMNTLQALRSERDFCVTLNRTERIDPGEVIRKIPYAHPVFTHAGWAAQRRHAEISSTLRRTHYCGAYWGFGFHEDGVVSALRVAEQLGGRL